MANKSSAVEITPNWDCMWYITRKWECWVKGMGMELPSSNTVTVVHKGKGFRALTVMTHVYNTKMKDPDTSKLEPGLMIVLPGVRRYFFPIRNYAKTAGGKQANEEVNKLLSARWVAKDPVKATGPTHTNHTTHV